LDQRDQWLATRTHPVYLLAKNKNVARLRAMAAGYGVDVTELGSGYWAALLPPSGGH
jgi:hypothetical protein